ncbi:hypothetical protein MNBD_GAMMA06-388 [hydrothermal vent metagenome]|uniref:Uncharacterized protein n=1 Tax=hydrothermal vent metagenome TaxID=652676 RepID=A0A3B0WQL4_9ZZZZ
MKIQGTNNYSIVTLCAIALLGMSAATVAVADNELNAGEIKKVRYISRALLQSRALEKKRIETEVTVQRVEIKKMEDSLSDLINNEMKARTKVSLTPVSTTNTATAVFSPQNNRSQKNTAAVSALSPESLSKKNKSQVLKIEYLKKQRMKRLQGSQDVIKETYLNTKRKLPSPFNFWRKKSTHDFRNENIVRVAEDIEQTLGQMALEGKINLQKLKMLHKKAGLHKADINFDDISRTLQTRTRHRVQ